MSILQTELAHELGMETKEHIFYTGLFLATLLPILSYTIDIGNPLGRRILLWIAVLVLLGGIMMDLLGGWDLNSCRTSLVTRGSRKEIKDGGED
ncbi:MAG: hypothetical protein QXQ57_04305 [Sulfolobales archaeon]